MRTSEWFDFSEQDTSYWLFSQATGYCYYCGMEADHFQMILEEFADKDLGIMQIHFSNSGHR